MMKRPLKKIAAFFLGGGYRRTSPYWQRRFRRIVWCSVANPFYCGFTSRQIKTARNKPYYEYHLYVRKREQAGHFAGVTPGAIAKPTRATKEVALSV